MSRPEDAYRSALNKVTASDDWKARTRAAMEAASSPAAPRLQVVKNPRRAWKGVLAAAACLMVALFLMMYSASAKTLSFISLPRTCSHRDILFASCTDNDDFCCFIADRL